MKQVRWGIIGLGNVAKIFANSFCNIKNANLVAIASNDYNKLKTFKNNLNLKNILSFNNYLELIQSEYVDAVYIALPNSLHLKWIEACLKNKKSTLVEKPGFMNFLEAIKIKDILTSNLVFFSEAMQFRYLPQTLKVIELIRQNKIGELTSMESYYGQNILTKKNIFGIEKKKKINFNNRLFNKNLGGGAILDLGCYPVSMSTLLASLIPGINLDNIEFNQKKSSTEEYDIDIDSYLQINIDNKFKSYMGASFKNNLGKSTRIIGKEGEIKIFDSWHGIPSKIILLGKKNEEFEIKNASNTSAYSMQLEKVSEFIITGKKQGVFPAPNIINIINNTKIIDHWKS